MMKSVLTLVSGREDRVLRRIRISEIVRNPNQPRRYFDPEAIATLAESIRQYGVLNPLTVRRTANGGYELVAGERRLRAARVAGLTDVPCLLINADGEDSSVIALVENLQRRDLDFFEEANGFKRLIEQFGLTQEEAARKVGKTQSAVANKLRLLRLSQQNMELIRCNNLTDGELCSYCSSHNRDDSLLCIVESVADLMVIEQSLSYHGRYFILMGRLSPLNGVGPHEIGLDKLLERAGEPEVKEVIIATSFTAEGEATAFAVSELLSKHYPQLKLTRIARGVPAGAEIEYTDVNTVAQAMLNRRVRESD